MNALFRPDVPVLAAESRRLASGPRRAAPERRGGARSTVSLPCASVTSAPARVRRKRRGIAPAGNLACGHQLLGMKRLELTEFGRRSRHPACAIMRASSRKPISAGRPTKRPRDRPRPVPSRGHGPEHNVRLSEHRSILSRHVFNAGCMRRARRREPLRRQPFVAQAPASGHAIADARSAGRAFDVVRVGDLRRRRAWRSAAPWAHRATAGRAKCPLPASTGTFATIAHAGEPADAAAARQPKQHRLGLVVERVASQDVLAHRALCAAPASKR